MYIIFSSITPKNYIKLKWDILKVFNNPKDGREREKTGKEDKQKTKW